MTGGIQLTFFMEWNLNHPTNWSIFKIGEILGPSKKSPRHLIANPSRARGLDVAEAIFFC